MNLLNFDQLNTLPKCLIVGANGYLGSHIYKYFKNFTNDLPATTRKKGVFDFLDLLKPCLASISIDKSYRFGIICSAITNIQQCEKKPSYSFSVNVSGTLNLAKQMIDSGITPVIFSSDVVFDGSENSYDESSKTNPLNKYGSQKDQLEKLLPTICGQNYLLLRMSKVYSTTKEDSTFLFDIARYLLSNKRVEAASDLVFNPICIDDVIQIICLLLKNNKRGLYTLSSPESTSWHYLATQLAQKLHIKNPNINKTSIDLLSSGIKRAKKLNLQPKRFSDEFPDFTFQALDESITKIAKTLTKKNNEKPSCCTRKN